MTSVYEQARQAYRDWVNSGMKRPDIKPVTVPVVKTEVENPKIDKPKTDIKKIHKKLVKKETLRNPQSPKRVVTKQQLENTKVYWSSLPSNQEPIVRGLSNFLGIDPDTITTNRAEALKEIVEKAVQSVGSDDQRKVFEWVHKMLQQGKISGDRKESQLRIYLRMI